MDRDVSSARSFRESVVGPIRLPRLPVLLRRSIHQRIPSRTSFPVVSDTAAMAQISVVVILYHLLSALYQ